MVLVTLQVSLTTSSLIRSLPTCVSLCLCVYQSSHVCLVAMPLGFSSGWAHPWPWTAFQRPKGLRSGAPSIPASSDQIISIKSPGIPPGSPVCPCSFSLLKPNRGPHPITMKDQGFTQLPGCLRVRQHNYILIIVLQHRILITKCVITAP